MKKWALVVTLLVLSTLVAAQTNGTENVQQSDDSSSQGTWHEAGPNDRMFFPKDMLWGWAQLDLAPPHNEIDPTVRQIEVRSRIKTRVEAADHNLYIRLDRTY